MTAGLPKAIQAQLEAAEQIDAQIARELNPEAPPAPPAANTPETPPAAPPAPEPQPPVAQQPAQAPAPAAPAPSEDGFEAKYRTLEGKYRAEVPRLSQQLREAQQLVQQLMQERQQQPQQPPQAQAPAAPEQPLVSPKDEDNFGADLLQTVVRIAMDVVAREVAKLRNDIRKDVGAVQEQVGQVGQTVQRSAMEQFWDRVRKEVTDWDAVDADQRWAQWLETTPEFSVSTWRQTATQAIQAGDASKLAKIVGEWKKAVGIQPAAQQPQPTVEPQPNPQEELSRQVAPQSSRASAPPAPAGRIWTKAEYEQVYDPRWFRTADPKEVQQKQAEADQALVEGRVRF